MEMGLKKKTNFFLHHDHEIRDREFSNIINESYHFKKNQFYMAIHVESRQMISFMM